jgi:hypothetical protein
VFNQKGKDMTIRDVKQALDETAASVEGRPIDDDEVQVVIRAGRAQVTITAGKNQVTIKSDKVLSTDKVQVTGKTPSIDTGHVFIRNDEVLDSAIMVLSQINEA